MEGQAQQEPAATVLLVQIDPDSLVVVLGQRPARLGRSVGCELIDDLAGRRT